MATVLSNTHRMPRRSAGTYRCSARRCTIDPPRPLPLQLQEERAAPKSRRPQHWNENTTDTTTTTVLFEDTERVSRHCAMQQEPQPPGCLACKIKNRQSLSRGGLVRRVRPQKIRPQRHARLLYETTRYRRSGWHRCLVPSIVAAAVFSCIPFLVQAQATVPSNSANNNTGSTLFPTNSPSFPSPTTSSPTDLSPTNRTEDADYFQTLPRCALTTQELVDVGLDETVDPCILFDIRPQRKQIIPYRTTTITLVQVTPATACRDARDGATTSVELLNTLNNHQGVAIGFQEDYHVQFRLVSLMAGNADRLGTQEYGVQHERVLRAALAATQAQYIVGTCSFASAFDKAPALEYQTMVLAQVGPPGYYSEVETNPYIFGVHINSDDYPLPTVQALGFRAALRDAQKAKDGGATKQRPRALETEPVRVIYRTRSEFFNSTCQSAIRGLRDFGFQNLVTVGYDPDGDEDKDGIVNQFDEGWLRDQADRICPPQKQNGPPNTGESSPATTPEEEDASTSFSTPAIFACVLNEQDIFLDQWKQNGCRPNSLWMTPATWGWAATNSEQVPYFQGGGQWHEAMTYRDRFFDSGTAMLDYNEEKFGYRGSYDTVVAYAIPMVFAEHIESFYRVIDDPDPASDFASEEGYERLRRSMVVLTTDTIFGPLAFNSNQRNSGRGAAGTQWQIDSKNNSTENGALYRNVLVSPNLQAEANVIIPAPSAVECVPGYYINETIISSGDAILGSKCDSCPVNTYTSTPNQQLECHPCPKGSTTGGSTGESYCVEQQDNLLSKGILAFGYTAVAITWLFSFLFMVWLMVNRKDPVVRISQLEFLMIVCVGAIISSSTIIVLGFQAGHGEDTDAASKACQAAPFLYTIGWVLQYGSLSAKSFRLNKILNHPTQLRVKVTFTETASFLAVILALDLIVVIAWTLVHPLEYIRVVDTVEMNEETNVMTISSYGSCAIEDGPSMWVFVGPIIAIHALLMITTNVILYKVRNIGDRYQEQKYIALCSLFVCEVLVVGLPVVISVGENSAAVFVVLSGIIGLNDIGTLCFVFIPKINFQRKGVSEGIAFGETILKTNHKKASTRESIRRSSEFNFSMAVKSQGPVSRLGSEVSAISPIYSRSEDISDAEKNQEEKEVSGSSFHRQNSLSRSSATKEQARRRRSSSKKLSQTPDTVAENEHDDDGEFAESKDGESGPLLRSMYDELALKNYDLELEMDEIKEREALLERKVRDLEEKLAAQKET